tara:strand:- start:27 stop:980 length:954 start_codon:yes stop_codon:yes gene_type:complete
MKTIRIAGAQIPVGADIQTNKIEIFKSLDWAKENEVDLLVTPEGSLSGYVASDWWNKLDELNDALKEVEDHQKKLGIELHLGTCLQETEELGNINRNEIRSYNKKGELFQVTVKSYGIAFERCVNKDGQPLYTWNLPFDERPTSATALICNDMWGCVEQDGEPINQLLVNANLDLIIHATNGVKFNPKDIRYKAFDAYHNGFLCMTALKALTSIITVDSCVPWDWDGEESKVDVCITSSQSGVVDFTGWLTDVPRFGRQYFYYDLNVGSPNKEKFNHLDTKIREDVTYPRMSLDWKGYHNPSSYAPKIDHVGHGLNW